VDGGEGLVPSTLQDGTTSWCSPFDSWDGSRELH
jgi:hypothetical protein